MDAFMKCAFFEKHISDYLNGSLSAEEKEAFKQHINTCRLCAQEKKNIDQLVNTIREQDVPDPGRSYWDSFNRRVFSQVDEQLHGKRWLSRFPLPRWAMAAAAAAFIVIAIAIPYLIIISQSPSLVELEDQIVEKIQEVTPAEAEGIAEELDLLRFGQLHLDQDFYFRESGTVYANGKMEYNLEDLTEESIIPYTLLDELDESEATLLIDQLKSEMG
jgi:hypothetical protein